MKHTKLKIALACDHAGFVSKKKLVPELSKEGYSVSDYGIYSETPADYPDVAEKVALAVQDGRIGRGVLICGSGDNRHLQRLDKLRRIERSNMRSEQP